MGIDIVNMETPNPEKKERPDWVWFLLIYYCLAVLFTFGNVLLGLAASSVQIDPIALGLTVIVAILRGIGFVRLFQLKKDSWIYLGIAFLIVFLSAVCDLIFGGTDFFLRMHHVFPTLINYAVNIAIIRYAFHIGNDYAKKQTDD